jgi:hypothetical protein
MKKFRITFILVIFFLSFFGSYKAYSQTEELVLILNRDFGYGGINNDIQGLYSMKVSGPADLIMVEFFIDNQSIGQVTKLPFNLQFNTDNYPLGEHELFAMGKTSAIKEYSSNVIRSNFVPASEGIKIALPILLVVFGSILVSLIVPVLLTRGKIQALPFGTERKYKFGGGICSKCQRPFAFPIFNMQLGFSRFTRCPYCGKWSLVRNVSMDKLRAAEKAELVWIKPDEPLDQEEDGLHKNLDDTRYQDT